MVEAASLHGQVALVTGSSGGIGAAVARSLAAEGAHVVVTSARSVAAGQEVAREVEGSYRQADLSDTAAARDLVAGVVTDLGRLDILVNNAGTTVSIPHHDLEAANPDIWRSIYELNVVAPWTLTVAAADALRRADPGPGCVVNVSSLAGVAPVGSSIPYACSKAALNHQTRLLAGTLGPQIRVNAVAPGLIETPWTSGEGWAATHQLVAARAPLGRVGTPADVAEAVLGLVRMTYVTGEVLLVDGGTGLKV